VLLMHDYLTERGRRERSEIALVMPLGVPVPPSPVASQALLGAFAERDISWHGERLVRALDPGRKVAVLSDGGEMPYDLFLGVPVHRAPAVVEESGMTVDGWIPVDPLTLETSFPGVFAVGDVTSVGTPKAGVFAEGQAAVVADRIVALVRGTAASTQYDGYGMCYLEFGRDRVARVDVTFLSGQTPTGDMEGPSAALAADKAEFGTTRIRRWFGRDW
jgi:sulfide:quinone oxidoreductase